ncbi:sigma-70 family RNA polymerase sigma factor [Candidatus Chrysopegis kryptomonas]|uniref:Regulatory protein, luxR family n=1 Tax=Candidatus Chryseopegocella kryptomonas TaxID=1633643 RepID=A0A0P1NX99_9BACT|nr:sigma-70 family RNA polymerase sigma factor [Candidatus Chrysopegis kryptomonas]CUT03408.1 regulatory protein, luxR family [Candidatus Chrysopegis kryptomonas]
MTAKEIKQLRNYALNLINDEDIVQDLLLKIIENNLNFPLAINYIKLSAKGSIFYKKRKEALNYSVSLSTAPADAENCTIEEIIQTQKPDPEQNFEIQEFRSNLTEKELEILNLIEQGFTVREICKKLKISSKTCTKILKSIRLKALEYFAFGEANPPKGSLGESLGPLGKENKTAKTSHL